MLVQCFLGLERAVAVAAVVYGSMCGGIEALIQGLFAAEVEKSTNLIAVQSVTRKMLARSTGPCESRFRVRSALVRDRVSSATPIVTSR